MSLTIIAIILSAAMLHAVWNAIVKTAADRTTTLGLVALGHVLPGAVMVAILPLPSPEAFIYIALSTFVHFDISICWAALINMATLALSIL